MPEISGGNAPCFRVLIVEDSPMLAKTLGWMVELLGHEVKTAPDGQSALDIALTFLPDVVLLDIGLQGGMNGYELCRRMRAEPALQHCVFVAQTGWTQPEHRRKAQEAGFDHHLAKPVELDTLEELFASLRSNAVAN